MPDGRVRTDWRFRVNVELRRQIPPTPEAGRVASLFGLADGPGQTLYRDFELRIAPGQIIAVTGPSGAGKTVLLREVARQCPGAVWLRAAAVGRSRRPAIGVLVGGRLSDRLHVLSRCGLAEAAALITPAARLSGGQAYRLALAKALHQAGRRGRATLVVADEFASTLDAATAANVCRRVRKLVRRSQIALLVATPRSELLADLRPDGVVVKPLCEPPRWVASPPWQRPPAGSHPARWPVQRGTIVDYRALARFHYLAGPPAAHERVFVVRPPHRRRGRARAAVDCLPSVAAVLVASPPLMTVRGRNLATAGRYAGPDRAAAADLLNREIECISRVIVHPIYRGCGLAVRLVRHALATAETPMVEALAAMGAVHPFFERAGMRAYRLGADRHAARLLSAAESVGLSSDALAAVGPVKALLSRRTAAAGFLRAELDVCIRRSLGPQHRRRVPDPVAEVCRRTARRYVYYLAERTREARPCR